MENKEQTILKITEEMIRTGGYNGFSFREVAKQVGIKSSSVHYHFPTKEDLGLAVAKYYTERFIASLGNPKDILEQGGSPIETYINAFKSALKNDKRMCLCGLLGAEIDGLPASVANETKTFFLKNLEWLEHTFTLSHGEKTAKKQAIKTLSLLEGALIASNVLGDFTVFETAAESLIESF